MGNAKIWYYPDPHSTVVEIDLGGPLSDLQNSGTVVQAASESVSGSIFTVQTRAGQSVRPIMDRFCSFPLYRQLETLSNHLRRGGSMSLAEDSAKVFAGYVVNLPGSGATTINTFSNPWPFAGEITLASGDEFCLQSASPRYLREMGLLTSHVLAGNLMTFPATVYDYSDEPWVLFRTRGFWPLLRLPIGERNQIMITTDHRISFTWDARLEEHTAGLDVFSGVADEQVVISTPFGGVIQQTVPEILEGAGEAQNGGGLRQNAAHFFS